ncbi:MAG: leucine-rich repeat domain-containing protein, partial [Anaeroplasmataceae bacterium]|nr:leucine-rich repeat domain-containing protein [Anaeroplasmataceae bacterium]
PIKVPVYDADGNPVYEVIPQDIKFRKVDQLYLKLKDEYLEDNTETLSDDEEIVIVEDIHSNRYYQATVSYYLPISLEKVTIYDTDIIGYGAFSNYVWLKDFNYHKIDFKNYNSRNDFEYTENKEETRTTRLSSYAFYNCDGIELGSFARTDGDGNTYFGFFGTELELGDYTFAHWTGSLMDHVVIAESIEEIGDHAFAESSIQSVEFDNIVTGTYTFANTDIMTANFNNDMLVNIDDGVFYNTIINVINDTTVMLPDFIRRIGNYTFYNCDNFLFGSRFLNQVVALGDYAFAYCGNIEEIVLPECLGVQPVSSASVEAILPEIGAHSFEHNINLRKITFENATIGDYMFANNMSIEEIYVPENIVYVGTHAFAYCENLTYVEYASNYIGDYMFYHCASTTDPQSFTFNSSDLDGNLTTRPADDNQIIFGLHVRYIGDFSFALLPTVSQITFDEDPSDLSVGPTYLGSYAFAFSAIQEITLPDSLEEIGEGVLAGCH